MKWITLNFLLFFIYLYVPVSGQETLPINTGTLIGIVKDSTTRLPLRSASVSIYNAIDSNLISYQLSGLQGGFRFTNLPVGNELQLIISFLGYKVKKKYLKIDPTINSLDLKELMLGEQVVELESVEIKSYRPPVQMRGDTLEFNAEAVKTEKNAVIEDMLKKLPGVVVWGDGLITVNGKAVKKVLVEGKTFFGGDSKIAIQNLPKEAVDKIQLYKGSNDLSSKLDSSLHMNIMLKKGWKAGLFGKAAIGYGTNKRYIGEVSASAFSPQTQFSIMGMLNNNNVIVNSVDQMIRNASFKGTGVNLELQPDFFVEGLNRTQVSGFTFLHEFIKDANQNKNNKTENSYLIDKRDGNAVKNILTTINVKADSNLINRYNEQKISSSINHVSKNFYQLQNNHYGFELGANLNFLHSKTEFNSATSALLDGKEIAISNSTVLLNEVQSNRNVDLFAKFNNKVKGIQFDYAFTANNFNNTRLNKTNFQSLINASQNLKFDREYNLMKKIFRHDLTTKVRNLNKVFGIEDLLTMSFLNKLNVNLEHNNNNVNDYLSNTSLRKENSYLTNANTYKVVDERPGFKVERNFEKILTNRFTRNLYFSVDLNSQIFYQKNNSEKKFQEFNHAYYRFTPNGKLKYDYYNDFTRHKSTYQLNFSTFTNYPTVNQIAPLVDSTDIYFRQYGNLNLKPSYKSELSFLYSLENLNRSDSPDSYTIQITLNQTKNSIANNILYDNYGRAYGSFININGVYSLNLVAEARKAFRVKDNLLQFILKPSLNNSVRPNFINNELNTSKILNFENNFTINYLLKDMLNLEFNQGLNFTRLRQGENYAAFTSALLSTRLIASLRVRSNINISTNITYNKNSATYANTSYFTLWNANFFYRFLKGNQGEIKVSALDILHQNKGVINYGDENTFTNGFVNVMQQYFMVALAYYPRIFGAANKKYKSSIQ